MGAVESYDRTVFPGKVRKNTISKVLFGNDNNPAAGGDSSSTFDSASSSPLTNILFENIIGLSDFGGSGDESSSMPIIGSTSPGDNYYITSGRASEVVNNSYQMMALTRESSILLGGGGDGASPGSGTTTASGIIESETVFYNSTNDLSSGVGSTDDLFRDYDLPLTQLAAVFCVIFIVLGVPGNLITIIALARCKKVRNATAYFIINLSACDLMFCCFNLPLAASMFWNRRWVHRDTLCRLFPFFRYGLMAVSIFTVLAITINRYVMIGHPRIYPRLYRTRYLGVMILLIWLGSFGALVPTLLGVWGQFELDKEIGSCSILPDKNSRSPKEFLFIIAFVLPCCAIIVCYARIFCIVRKATANLRPVEIPSSTGNVNHSLETESLSPDQATILRRTSARPSIAVIHQKGKMTNKDRKLLWMILVIFGAFVVCYLPITIFKAFKQSNSTWNIFGYLLIYMTTCINPLVYVLMSSDYRQAYTNLFLCRKDWNLSSRTSNSNKT